MSDVEIIGSSRSSYTRVVRMVCEEKAIDYTLTETPLGAPSLLAIHPFGKMPLLRHGDCHLPRPRLPWPSAHSVRTKVGRPHRAVGVADQYRFRRHIVRNYLLAYAVPGTADGKPDRQAIDAVRPRCAVSSRSWTKRWP
jgi:glutathione S-transferase